MSFAGGELTSILEASWDEQLAKLDERGMAGCFSWSDVYLNIDANAAATRLYAEAIRRVVNDPQTAEDLVPHYPFGCKRVIIDDGYFETYNRENVQLINLRRNAIECIKPDGIQLQDGFIGVDVIVYATGFDAMTGALSRIDVRGRDHVVLRDVWAESPKAYLGLGVAGFPNLFTVTGPGSPSVLDQHGHVDRTPRRMDHRLHQVPALHE